MIRSGRVRAVALGALVLIGIECPGRGLAGDAARQCGREARCVSGTPLDDIGPEPHFIPL